MNRWISSLPCESRAKILQARSSGWQFCGSNNDVREILTFSLLPWSQLTERTYRPSYAILLFFFFFSLTCTWVMFSINDWEVFTPPVWLHYRAEKPEDKIGDRKGRFSISSGRWMEGNDKVAEMKDLLGIF